MAVAREYCLKYIESNYTKEVLLAGGRINPELDLKQRVCHHEISIAIIGDVKERIPMWVCKGNRSVNWSGSSFNKKLSPCNRNAIKYVS